MGEKQDERRKEILEAALNAFMEKGYDKTSMDEVVRATGLSKGTIYWYFENKQVLFMALMEYVIDQFFGEFDQRFEAAENMPPAEALSVIFDATNSMLDMNPRLASLTIDFMLQALQSPDMRQKYAEYYTRYIAGLAGVIQRGIDEGDFNPVDPYDSASALIGMMDGIMMQALVGDLIKLDWHWQVTNVLQAAEMLLMKGLLKVKDHDDE